MNRREFVVSTAAAATLPYRRRLTSLGHLAGPTDAFRARPFAMTAVRLRPGPFLDALQVNQRFLLGLDPDRLLHMFRVTAGLPSSAEPLGGWEAPENELRGHYTGHYLSACSLLWASTGDAGVKARVDSMVAELAKCQQALGTGYLSAFPEEFFDRLRDGKPVWAPWYTVHKILAGLLDAHMLTGNAQALTMAKGLGHWTARWVQPLGDEAMERILEREFGGMNDALYNLAAITGEPAWQELAHRFDHERIFAPLARGRDELKGLHVNTTIPKITGAARRYEVTGDPRARRVAEYFWEEVTTHRTFCTGGTSNGENWNAEPGVIAGELSAYTQECCTSYNMLKLTRHLFQWTADPRVADYYERLLWNGVLGAQHPADGSKLYYVPLAGGYWKLFGTPLHDFWCCTGTGSESFAKLGDSIYFQDDAGIFVNLFIASELEWAERQVRLVQDTRFPESGNISFTIHVARPTRFALRIRIPQWAGEAGSVALNGRSLEEFATPGSYFVLTRSWKDGDRVEVSLPMSLRLEPTPDDPSLQAVMYGPLVLIGRLGTAGLTPATLRAEPTKPRTVPEFKLDPVPVPALHASDSNVPVAPVPGRELEFRSTGPGEPVTLVPFYRLFDERYAVYWKVTA